MRTEGNLGPELKAIIPPFKNATRRKEASDWSCPDAQISARGEIDDVGP
jgi:hypothetical protein